MESRAMKPKFQNSIKNKRRIFYSIFSKWSLAGVVFFFTLFSFGNFVEADIIQNIHSDSSDCSDGYWCSQNLGTGISGTLTQVSWWINNNGNYGASTQVQIYIYSDSSYSSLVSWREDSNTGWSSVGLNSITLATPEVFNSSYYYRIQVHKNSGGSGSVLYGGSNSLISGFPATSNNGFNTGSGTMYLNLIGINFPTSNTSSYFVSWLPEATSTPTTTPTILSGVYYSGTKIASSSPTLGLYLLNQDTGENWNFDLGPIATSTGTHTFSTTTPALSNGLYHYSLVFNDSPNEYVAETSSFIINGTSFPAGQVSLYFPHASSTVPTSLTEGLSECEALSFPSNLACSLGTMFKNILLIIFSPSADSVDRFRSLADTLKVKAPFAYAYDMNDLRMELFNATENSTSSVSLSFKIIPGAGTSTLEVFSKDKLASIPFSNTIKTVMGWILWLLACEYIYYRVIKIHDK